MRLNRIPLAGCLLLLAGCVTVRKVQPTEYIPQQKPTMVWVTTTDNAFTPVSQPQIVGDTLKGTWAGLQEPVAISLNEISSVQAKLKSPKRTAMLATVVTAATVGVVYTIATAGNGGNPNFLGCGYNKGTPNNYCCVYAAGESTKDPNC